MFDESLRPTAAFLERTLEALLNGAFIRRSGATADNHGMSAHPSLTLALARRNLLAGLALLCLTPAGTWAGDKDDHDRARAAVQAGEVLPLQMLLERLQRSHPGQVLELELEREEGRWIYEIKLLQPDGQLVKLEVDAATAQVLALKRKDKDKSKSDARR